MIAELKIVDFSRHGFVFFSRFSLRYRENALVSVRTCPFTVSTGSSSVQVFFFFSREVTVTWISKLGFIGEMNWNLRAKAVDDVRKKLHEYAQFDTSLFDYDGTIYDIVISVRVSTLCYVGRERTYSLSWTVGYGRLVRRWGEVSSFLI